MHLKFEQGKPLVSQRSQQPDRTFYMTLFHRGHTSNNVVIVTNKPNQLQIVFINVGHVH